MNMTNEKLAKLIELSKPRSEKSLLLEQIYINNAKKARELCGYSQQETCKETIKCYECPVNDKYLLMLAMAGWKDKKALEACEKLLDKISTYKYNVVGISKDHLLNEFMKYLNE